jgi:hypothetical protein
MRTSRMVFLSCLLVLLIADTSPAQWVQTNGPFGGTISAFASSGTNLFAGAYPGGVFLSTNNGTNWTGVNSGLTNDAVDALLVAGGYLFAGTDGGAFRSANNGTSWAPAGLTGISVNCLASMTNGQGGVNLFAGTWGNGVYMSATNGTSWTAVNTGLTNKNINLSCLVAKDSTIFVGTWGAGVFRSTNNGASWTPVNTGLTGNKVTVLKVKDTCLFAGISNAGAFRSTDNGATWTAVNSGITTLSVNDFAVAGTTLFTGGSGGAVYFSTNNGTSWVPVPIGLSTNSVWTLAAYPAAGGSGTNIYAGMFGEGVFVSTNSGVSWKSASTGLIATEVNDLAVAPSTSGGTNIFAATVGGVFLSTSSGGSWSSVTSGVTDAFVYAVATSGTNVFVGTDNGGGVFLSTNNGTSWTPVNSGLTTLNVTALCMSGTNLFAGTETGGVFLSTNNGTTWTAVNNGLSNLNIFSLAACGSKILAGTQAGLFTSTNNGSNWTLASSAGVKTAFLHGIAECPGSGGSGSHIFAGTHANGVFMSSDSGASWAAVNTGLTSMDLVALAPYGRNIFAGSSTGLVFLSTNYGTNWSSVSTGLPGKYIRELAVDPGSGGSGATLIAALLGGGVWRRPLSEVVSVREFACNALPREFSLSQNYPNPFNPTTNIEFSIARAGSVKMTVIDALGREVATLANGLRGAGTYTVQWDASSFPSGVYFYKLETSGFTETRKLLLLK